MEDYLKAIFHITEETPGATVTTTALAERLDVAPASVTAMLKKLAELELVRHEPYRGVFLTPAGRKIALEIVRHHRLIELYLVEALGMGWDEVHEEAERLEHVISEAFEARISEALKHPRFDPHGDPIPSADLEYEAGGRASLADLAAGTEAVVSRVSDRDPETLRRLAALGLVPNARVVVVSVGAPGDAMVVSVEARERSLPRELARAVQVATTSVRV